MLVFSIFSKILFAFVVYVNFWTIRNSSSLMWKEDGYVKFKSIR